MSQSRIDDLVDRLTSRKLILCVVSILLAIYGHASGHLTFEQLQMSVLTAVGIFSGAEGLADAAAAFRPKPDAPTQTVNVDTQAAPSRAEVIARKFPNGPAPPESGRG